MTDSLVKPTTESTTSVSTQVKSQAKLGSNLLPNRESLDLDLDFNRYLLALKRRWLPGVSIFALTVAASVFATSFLETSYQSEGKLLFKAKNPAAITGLGSEVGQLQPLLANQTPLTTEIEVISSNPILEKTIKQLKLKDDKGNLLSVKDFKSALKLKILGGTDVIQVTYENKDAQKAADIVNALMQNYIDNNILKNRSEAVAAQDFISKELPDIEKQVFAVEADLRKFKEENQILDLTQEAQSTVVELAALKKEITTVESSLKGIKAQATELQSKLGLNLDQAVAVSILSRSSEVQGTLVALREVETQLANEKSRFLSDHPIVVNLENKKNILQTSLQEKIRQTFGNNQTIPIALLQSELAPQQSLINDFIAAEVQRLNLTQQLASLYNSLARYQKRSQVLPKLEQRQQELDRKAKVARATYETLLTKQLEIQVAENQNTGNVQIIEPAVVPQEGSTGRIKVVALGILLGLFLGTSSVLVLEIKDKSLKTLQEIQEIFGYTLLGIIPLYSKNFSYFPEQSDLELPPIIVKNAPESLVSEMYRMIQANLKFLSSDHQLKTIVISSSVPKEGKSAVAANLAATIAQLGRKVLLIDADLRHPCQHHIWDELNIEGLSNILVNQAEFEPIPCEDISGLDLVTAGVTPPNPLALLDSQRMASLLKTASAQYDYVIIDAPSLLLRADALTLGLMSDGILLVERPGVVDRESALRAKEMLQRSNQNVLGLVVNGIDNDESKRYFGVHFSENQASSKIQIYKKQKEPQLAFKALSKSQVWHKQFSNYLAATALGLSLAFTDVGIGIKQQQSQNEDHVFS